jgi:hypothetical protein
MKIKLIAVSCCCCAFLSIMLFGTGAASATTRHSAHRAHRAHRAHSASDPYVCLWENAYGNPKLWIRQYPSTDARTIYSITYHGHFWATKYDAYNDNVHWVQLQSGGWANASYLWHIGGGTESYCTGH